MVLSEDWEHASIHPLITPWNMGVKYSGVGGNGSGINQAPVEEYSGKCAFLQCCQYLTCQNKDKM